MKTIWFLVGGFLLTACITSNCSAESATDSYAQRVFELINKQRNAISRLSVSADLTAQAFLAGGSFYLAGDNGWVSEGFSRAGGLLSARRQNIYTDFADLIGEEGEIDLPGFAAVHDVERFRDKTQQFLKAHENDPVIHKLRWNEPLSKADLDALEKILVDAGAGTPYDLSKVRSSSGLGLFVREMIGLDREAAKRAFDGFLAGKTLNANQIHFINLVIDYLTQAGWMSAAQLYESPFTDFSPRGVEGVFDSPQVTQLLSVLDSIRQTLRGHIKSGQRWSLQNRPTKVAWD